MRVRLRNLPTVMAGIYMTAVSILGGNRQSHIQYLEVPPDFPEPPAGTTWSLVDRYPLKSVIGVVMISGDRIHDPEYQEFQDRVRKWAGDDPE